MNRNGILSIEGITSKDEKKLFEEIFQKLGDFELKEESKKEELIKDKAEEIKIVEESLK